MAAALTRRGGWLRRRQLNRRTKHLGVTVAARRVFLYRAAVLASMIDRKSDAGDGHVAEWLRSGLQNRLPRFNSGRGLQLPLRNIDGRT